MSGITDVFIDIQERCTLMIVDKLDRIKKANGFNTDMRRTHRQLAVPPGTGTLPPEMYLYFGSSRPIDASSRGTGQIIKYLVPFSVVVLDNRMDIAPADTLWNLMKCDVLRALKKIDDAGNPQIFDRFHPRAPGPEITVEYISARPYNQRTNTQIAAGVLNYTMEYYHYQSDPRRWDNEDVAVLYGTPVPPLVEP